MAAAGFWSRMGEEEGFEPSAPCGAAVFGTVAFGRSATPPGVSMRRGGRGVKGGGRYHEAQAVAEPKTVHGRETFALDFQGRCSQRAGEN